MGEIRSSTGRRSEIELSTLPEVAALATELTLIFRSLELSQQQYAIRTNYDKSYVSRFLNGRRVATQDFIERLLTEVEKHRRVPITEQTRTRLSHLRAAALRVYDPDLHELESIRNEADKYQREVARLLLHQEALEGLLERKQAEAGEARIQLARAQSDWIAEKVQTEAEILALRGQGLRNEDDRKALLDEISRLQEELKLTIEQRDVAQQRCALLEGRANTVEAEVADKRERDDVDDVGLPVEVIQERLKSADDTSIYREIMEFASSRAGSHVVTLAIWLQANSLKDHATQLVTGYCRQRPVSASVNVVIEAEGQCSSHDVYEYLVGCVAQVVSRRSLDDLFEFIEQYVTASRAGGRSPHSTPLSRAGSSWINSRNEEGRDLKFFDIVDFMRSRGQEASAVSFMKLKAGQIGMTRYGSIVAESGREADIKLYASLWAERMKPGNSRGTYYSFARQLKTVSEFPDSLLLEAILEEMLDTYSMAEIAEIHLHVRDNNPDSPLARDLKKRMKVGGIWKSAQRFLSKAYGVQYES
ncbi:helix-turn-helix domain-containing protein [Streptomyces sp. Midd1]|uniref:helix-turn-helix domain-containing protein n=1 Tax=Streptomyces sp. Midd3 TaxID=3161191 RepID=UPI0034DB0171